jgi:hypothetical protein
VAAAREIERGGVGIRAAVEQSLGGGGLSVARGRRRHEIGECRKVEKLEEVGDLEISPAGGPIYNPPSRS